MARNVTSIAEIREAAGGVLVDVPGFSPSEVITLKLRRPSLLDMAATGKIPNPLLNAAALLFKGGTKEHMAKMGAESGEDFRSFAETLRCIAREALVEPTFEELHNNGVELTDVQLLYIYNYTQSGVDSLRPFRDKPANNTDDKPGAGV